MANMPTPKTIWRALIIEVEAFRGSVTGWDARFAVAVGVAFVLASAWFLAAIATVGSGPAALEAVFATLLLNDISLVAICEYKATV